MGIIAAVGDSVNDLKVGMPCAFMTFGGYAEFTEVRSVYHIVILLLSYSEIITGVSNYHVL